MSDKKKPAKEEGGFVTKAGDPKDLTVDAASAQMIWKARQDGVETIFDRAAAMKPCNIGASGICCKNCAQGPCRVVSSAKNPNPIGLCGATPETIAARNFARMVAAGAAAHSDHGRGVAETFLAAARGRPTITESRTRSSCARSPRTSRWRSRSRRPTPTATRSPRTGTSGRSPRKSGSRRWASGASRPARSTTPSGLLKPVRTVAQAGRGSPGNRPGDRRDHAPDPHGC